MYEMVTGHVPFDGDSTVTVALKHLQEEIIAPGEEVSDLPYSLECIIMKCTQKNPALRYHDCASLLTDLKRSLVDPDGDFVVLGMGVSSDTDRTVVMSTEELERVQQHGYDDDDDYDDDDYDDDDDEYDDDRYQDRRSKKKNENPDTRRIMKVLMIVAGVVVALLILFLVANAAGFFSGPSGLTQNEGEEETVKVPDLRGMTEEEARKAIEDLELGLDVAGERQPSNQYAEGEIMNQNPAPDDEVAPFSTIEVVISSGEEAKMVQVPNVVGRSESDAENTLRAANLTVVYGEAAFSNEIAEGDVISSNPSAGTEVEEGTEVTIIVSLGEEPATVPNLVNKSASAAESALSDAGLNGSSSEEYSDDVPEGRVIRQSIDAGTEVDPGTTVEYVVSLGPETTYVTVPGLGGYTENQAIRRLEEKGLSVGTIDYAYSDTVGAGYVISQTASPGSSVEEGTTVGFTVSQGPEPQQPQQPETPDGDTNGGDSEEVSEGSEGQTE